MVKEIWKPAKIGSVEMKNRIIMAPMGDALQSSEKDVTETMIRYFVERAKGGVGLIFQTGLASPNFHIRSGTVWLDKEDRISRLCQLTRAVHTYGVKIGIMLGGGFGYSIRGTGGVLPYSPSPMPLMEEPDQISVEMTTEQVELLIADFAAAARIAQRAGYDMVTIQGYAGYLLDQFITECWNKRKDRFGGSFEERMNFPRELIAAIQEKCGKDYPIIWKLCPTHDFEGGRKLEEGIKIAKLLEELGVSAIQVDIGAYGVNPYSLIQPVYQAERVKQFDVASEIKKHVSIPVFTQGKVGDPVEAEAVYKEGKTDFIVLGRSFLADPAWAKKVHEDRIEDIVPCICCLDGCIGAPNSHARIETYNEDSPSYCAVNPFCAQEANVSLEPAADKKKILVIGAGPAGMEAALTAAKRGHEVELWEKTSALGGAMCDAGAPANKKDIRRLIEYYKAQIYKNNGKIRLRLNKCANAAMIKEAAPDYVIFANGGIDIVPEIPGIGLGNVYSTREVLQDMRDIGERVVVVGGGFVGCETAMHLGHHGKKVTIVEMQDDILTETSAIHNKLMLKSILDQYGVEIKTRTTLMQIRNGEVVCDAEGEKESILCDAVVTATGKKNDCTLRDAVADDIECTVIGDALKPGRILEAVWNGFAAASVI